MSLLLSLLIGCGTTDPPTAESSEPSPERPPTIEDIPYGEGDIFAEASTVSRSLQRMNVDQLRASMQQISGTNWVSGNTDLWTKYSSTLGVPDYMESISEDLTASVIFQKFLADAATYSCEGWINRELLAGAPEEQRGHSFFQHVTPDQRDSQAILENIQHLRYLMHGRSESLEAPIIESAFALHQLVLQRSDDVLAAWNTVCVAFVTHPDFYTY